MCAGAVLTNSFVYATVILGWTDKVLPLCLIGLGFVIGLLLSRLKYCFLRQI